MARNVDVLPCWAANTIARKFGRSVGTLNCDSFAGVPVARLQIPISIPERAEEGGPPTASSGSSDEKPTQIPGPPGASFATGIGGPTGSPEVASQTTTMPEQRAWLPFSQPVFAVAMKRPSALTMGLIEVRLNLLFAVAPKSARERFKSCRSGRLQRAHAPSGACFTIPRSIWGDLPTLPSRARD